MACISGESLRQVDRKSVAAPGFEPLQLPRRTSGVDGVRAAAGETLVDTNFAEPRGVAAELAVDDRQRLRAKIPSGGFEVRICHKNECRE